MIERDPLHFVALILTFIAAISDIMSGFLPNWWILKNKQDGIISTYSLFGDIYCRHGICYPGPDMRNETVKEEDGQMLTTWLSASKVLSIIGMVLVILALFLQLVFLKIKAKNVTIAAIGTLLAAGIIGFITGFLFMSQYTMLSTVYARDWPPGALIYNPGAAAFPFLASILCVVASVATMYGMLPRTKKSFMYK